MMGIPKTIKINTKNGKKTYYYWDEYDSWDEAKFYGNKIKLERKSEMSVKYFVLEAEDSWFLPVPKFVLYLNRKLKLI